MQIKTKLTALILLFNTNIATHGPLTQVPVLNLPDEAALVLMSFLPDKEASRLNRSYADEVIGEQFGIPEEELTDYFDILERHQKNPYTNFTYRIYEWLENTVIAPLEEIDAQARAKLNILTNEQVEDLNEQTEKLNKLREAVDVLRDAVRKCRVDQSVNYEENHKLNFRIEDEEFLFIELPRDDQQAFTLRKLTEECVTTIMWMRKQLSFDINKRNLGLADNHLFPPAVFQLSDPPASLEEYMHEMLLFLDPHLWHKYLGALRLKQGLMLENIA